MNAPVVVGEPSARERGEATDDKILAALAALTDRLSKLESSQRVRNEDERMIGAVESGMFASKLGTNMRGCPMTIDALGSLEDKPEAPRARARWRDNGELMFASLAPPRGQPSAQHCMPAGAAELIAAPRQEAPPSATHMAAAISNYAPRVSVNSTFASLMDWSSTKSWFFHWECTFMRAVTS